jgi:hypothetical protein
MERFFIRAAAALVIIAGAGLAAGPAMASSPPQSVGGQTNISATVEDQFVVVGFPTAVNFAAVEPGQTTAGTATAYSVETNHSTGYTVAVAIDSADRNNGAFPLSCSGACDIMRNSAATAFIPLSSNLGGDLTVQHADSSGNPLGPVQQIASETPVTIVTTSGPENGTVSYEDLFTLAIPGGIQASGTYSAQLDYTLSENA